MDFGVILLFIFVPACVALLFYAIIYISAQRADSKKPKKAVLSVCMPNQYSVIGGAVAAFFGIFMLFSPMLWQNENNSFIIFYLVFGAFFWLGIYLVIKTMRFKIIVDGGKLTVYPLFSRAYTFTFEDINSVERQTKNQYKRQTERIVIHTKQKRRIVIENSFMSYFKLVDKIQECVDLSKLKGFEEK